MSRSRVVEVLQEDHVFPLEKNAVPSPIRAHVASHGDGPYFECLPAGPDGPGATSRIRG
ncbi:MAG: hypothetical protein ACREJR_09685 [Candidatus Rokuibacteriota bacterium]